ncbi:hypothetical protein INR49_028954 [Caranx melampygus]|nr:hypothetical protein INR49_028954 [Caranx melampygus]
MMKELTTPDCFSRALQSPWAVSNSCCLPVSGKSTSSSLKMRLKSSPSRSLQLRWYWAADITPWLTAEGAGSTTLLLRGIPVKPGGGLGAETPRPGGGGGIVEDGAGAEAFIGKDVGRSVFGVEFEELEAAVEGLPLPVLTVSREEISNMVGTERNSCCVIPPLSSSDKGGERADAAFPLSPTFFFRFEDAEVEEERS